MYEYIFHIGPTHHVLFYRNKRCCPSQHLSIQATPDSCLLRCDREPEDGPFPGITKDIYSNDHYPLRVYIATDPKDLLCTFHGRPFGGLLEMNIGITPEKRTLHFTFCETYPPNKTLLEGLIALGAEIEWQPPPELEEELPHVDPT